MTPAWMLASALIAVLFAAAAFAISRVVALYRGIPLRWIWAVATIASVVVTVLWLRPTQAVTTSSLDATAPAPSAFAVAERKRENAPRTIVPASATTAAAPASRRPWTNALRWQLRVLPDFIATLLQRAWLAMSVGLLSLITYAALRIQRERSHWQAREIADVEVLVAATFGPAVVGVVRPSIVVPEWVTSLDAAAQRAIVAHEAEHRAAMDPLLVLLGLAAVVLMPWNPGLWLSWRGLRRAVELDCDERVVRRGIEGGEYARVLLNAWKTARGTWIPSTAFAERASGLGARVEHLMRPEPRGRAMRTLVGSTVGAGLVFLACATPAPQMEASRKAGVGPYPLVIVDGVRRPDLPPLRVFTGAVRAETTTTPTYRISYHGPQRLDTAAQKLYPSMEDGTMMQIIDAPASVKHFGDAAKYGAVLFYTRKFRDAGGAIIAPQEGDMAVRRADPNTPASVMTGRIYANLFNGITLPADREAQARAIIEASYARQHAFNGPALAIWPLRVADIDARDAQLRNLLTTESDRARFDQRSNEGRPSGSVTLEGIVKSEYGNLFGYPDDTASSYRVALAPDKQEQARAIIRTHINDELALYARAPGEWTSTREQRLEMRMKRDAALRALVSDDAEREKFDRLAARLREMTFSRR